MPATQVLELQDALLEDRLGQIVARVALGAAKGLDDVAERELADLQLFRQLGRSGLPRAGDAAREARCLSRTTSGVLPNLSSSEGRDGVALGVNPGAVERMLTLGDLEESGRLGVGRRPDSLDLHQLLTSREGPFVLAVIDDPPGRQLIEARDMPQQGDAGRIEIDTDEVDATGDDRLERLLELLGVDIVLVEPDADVLGLDLDQLGQRILEPAADRDRAAQRCVELGQLFPADLAGRVNAGSGLVDDHIGELGQQRVGGMWSRRGRGRRGRRGRLGARPSRTPMIVLSRTAAAGLVGGFASAGGAGAAAAAWVSSPAGAADDASAPSAEPSTGAGSAAKASDCPASIALSELTGGFRSDRDGFRTLFGCRGLGHGVRNLFGRCRLRHFSTGTGVGWFIGSGFPVRPR